MWAVYGYEYNQDTEQDGSGTEGYVGPFSGLGNCAEGCTDCSPCKLKPYLPWVLVGVGAALFLGIL